MTKSSLDKHLRNVLRDGQQAYRKALAAEIRGEDSNSHWDIFHQALAALLLSSYLFGAKQVVSGSGMTDGAIRNIAGEREEFALNTGVVLRGFAADYLRPIANWFRNRVPITRYEFDSLMEACRLSAGDVTQHERMHALQDMLERTPELRELLRGAVRYKTGGKGVMRDTFYVTGMTAQQTKQTQELIARVIEERPGKSVVGKWIRKMNLGDFVTTTKAVTGTHLTTARLETVLRTNTNRASTEGLAETLRDPKVQAFVPLVEYSAIRDNRTRPTHAAFHGYIGTMDMFDRQQCAPPCGFNCRCSLIPVPAARAVERGWTDIDGNVNHRALAQHNRKQQKLIDSGQIPDPGFTNA